MDEGLTPEMIKKLLADAFKHQQLALNPVERTFLMVSKFTGYTVQELKEMPQERVEKYIDTLLRGGLARLQSPHPGSTLN